MDTKAKVEIVIIGFLIIILGAVSIRAVRKLSKPAERRVLPTVVTSQEKTKPSLVRKAEVIRKEKPESPELSEEIRLQKERLTEPWGRDPFTQEKLTFPGEEKGPEAYFLSGLKLSGISLKADGNFAIINGEIVKVGDTINGAKIIQIDENEVVFQKNNEKLILRLGES